MESYKNRAFLDKAVVKIYPGFGCYYKTDGHTKLVYEKPVEALYFNYSGYYPTNYCEFVDSYDHSSLKSDNWLMADALGGYCAYMVVIGVP